MDYAIISVGHELGGRRSAGDGPSQGTAHWRVSESEVPGDQLGQVLKRYKNRMIIVVDVDQAADMVARLNQEGSQDAAKAIADATAAEPDQPIP